MGIQYLFCGRDLKHGSQFGEEGGERTGDVTYEGCAFGSVDSMANFRPLNKRWKGDGYNSAHLNITR